MSGQQAGSHAPRGEQPEDRGLHHEEAGLREHGPVEQCGVGGSRGGAEDVPERPGDVPGQPAVDGGARLVEGGPERRERRVQPPSHGGALAALAGEEERDPARHRRAADQPGERFAGRQRGQSPRRLGVVAGDDDGAVGQGRAGGRGGEGQVGQPMAGEDVMQPARLPA
jgi:hypothetical protein